MQKTLRCEGLDQIFPSRASYSGYEIVCLKSSETTKNTKTQRSTSQPGRSFLFIFLNKSLDLTSFSVHRSPYLFYFSYKVSLIFSTVCCIATPARPTQRLRVTYSSANYFTPFFLVT